MEAMLGNSDGEPIPMDNFTVGSYYDNSHIQKPGIYLLTKAKVCINFTDLRISPFFFFSEMKLDINK